MIVKLREPEDLYPDLSADQTYVVIGVEADDYRVLNDQGRPYLYPADFFEVIDAREPEDWISDLGEDGERYAYPASLNTPGFFEDFFNAQQTAVRAFWREVNQRLTLAAA
jgi:hypothetical protein